MFKFYSRKEIDVRKWDDCILRSNQSIVYGLSWYLDIVTPGWEALIIEGSSGYLAVAPIPMKKRLGFKIVFRPFLTQQLGLFSSEDLNTKSNLSIILEKIKQRYQHIYYTFNVENNQHISDALEKI